MRALAITVDPTDSLPRRRGGTEQNQGFVAQTVTKPFLVIALLFAVPTAAQIQFRTSTTAPLEQSPSAIAAADLDADGVTDLVVAHAFDPTVSVFLGSVEGGLQTPEAFFAGGPTRSLLVHDIDADGVLDVLVAEEDSERAWFLPGAGDGAFGDPVSIVVGDAPVDVAAQDLDGDGNVDLAVALAGIAGGQVSTLKGNGDGTFAPPSVVELPSVAAQEVAIGDLNQDGIPDLAVTNAEPGSVSVLLGTGNLGLAEPFQLATGPATSALEIADVNEDGRADLIVGVSGLNVIVAFIGRGDGSFNDAATFDTGGTVLSGLRVADVNADGHLDLVATNLRSQSTSVLLGAGDGTFAPARGFVADVGPVDAAVFDVNRDGHADVVTANQGVGGLAPTLAYLFGDGSGTFAGIEQIASDGATIGGAVADFDGDAVADAALLRSGQGGVTLRFGAAHSPRRAEATFNAAVTSVAIEAGDVDADDRPDVVTANGTPDLSFLFGTGQGAFAAPVTVALDAPATALALDDCDGDGDGDVVIAQSGTGIRISAVRNDGNRTFSPLAPVRADGRIAGMAVSDFTGDRVLDIAVGDAAGMRLLLLTGNGDCTFTAATPSALPTIPVRLAAVKLADDNVDDLIVVGAGQRNLVAVLNDGSGNFTPGQPRSGGNVPLGVAVRDLNADAISDIVLGDRTADAVTVIRRSGAGILLPEQELLASIRPAEILTGDFDGDGRYDVLSTGTTTCELVNVTAITPLRRGDANGDARHSVADITALFIELYDGDGARVDDVPHGDFAANQGADANGDGTVDRLDLAPLLARLNR